jgi:hypothetical protein
MVLRRVKDHLGDWGRHLPLDHRIEIFKARIKELADHADSGSMKFLAAVDQAAGLGAMMLAHEIGTDAVQAILAEAFRKVRR